MKPEALQPYDVVVIGGGLAGGAAASQLARNGVKTLLLEKETQAHHKVCGEFISYEAQDYLTRLGVNVRELGAVPINNLKLSYKNKSYTTQLGFQAISLSRSLLDEAVLKNASLSGAKIRRGMTVTSLERNGTHWRITCHESGPIIAKAVFLATGKHDLRGWPRGAGKQNDYIGFKMHYRLSAQQYAALAHTVEVILYRGGYAGLESIEDGRANLCLVISKAQFSACGKTWDRLLQTIMLQTPELAARLLNAVPCWDKPLAISGIPYGFVYRPSRCDTTTLFRLGDQMAVIPSLCGDGMAIALHTGFLAADFYLNVDARAYHQNAYRQLSPQINYAANLTRLLSSPVLQSLALPFFKLMPRLVSRAIERTRLAV